MAESFRSPVRLALGETRMQLRLLRRNPVSVLFTVALPLLLLPLLDALQGDVFVRLPAATPSGGTGSVTALDGRSPWMQYATPAIAAFAVVTACFANLAIRTAVARESGVLKRVRGTPLPPSIHLAGRICSNALVALLVAAVTIGAGVVLYDVEVAATDLPVLAALVVLASAVFSALGLATTAIIPNSDAAPAVVYALLFPLAFVSNVFYPPELAPEWMERTAEALPLGPFVSAMVGAMTPSAVGSGVVLGELSAMVGWGIFGLTVALVAFRWVPNRERTKGALPSSSRAIRWLAIPLGLLAAAVGVLVPEERPVQVSTVGTTAQLDQSGTTTTEILVASSEISSTSSSLTDPGSFLAQTDTVVTVPFHVSVIDRGNGPEALGFQGCAADLISSIDPAWLASVAPPDSAAAFAQPCNGAIYDTDFACLAGPCLGPLAMPTSVDGDQIGVKAEGVLVVHPDAAALAPPIPVTSYIGTLTLGDDDADAVLTSMQLTADENGVALADQTNGWEVRFASTSPWLGSIGGFDVLGPPAMGELLASVFAVRPLPFASVAVGDERSIDEGATAFTASQAEAGVRRFTFGPSGDSATTTPRGSVRLSTTGELLEWETIELDAQVEGSPRVRLDLQRVS